MQRRPNPLRYLVLSGVVFLAAHQVARAAEPGWAGRWVLTEIDHGTETDLVLLQIDARDGKPQARILSVGLSLLKDSKVTAVAPNAQTLKLLIQNDEVKLPFTLYLPADEPAPKKLFGVEEFTTQRYPVEMERSTEKALDPNKTVNEGPAKALNRVQQIEDEQEQETGYRALLVRFAGRPVAIEAETDLVGLLARRGAAEAELRKHAEAALKLATPYGPEIKRETLLDIARQLTKVKTAALAVEYARQAVKSLPADEPRPFRYEALRVLSKALHKAGSDADAKEIDAERARIDDELDREFLKSAVPFTPEVFKGRRGTSDRVAVLELFTGAECPPCIAPDIAFDALRTTFKPGELVLLQYHRHSPLPDPLAFPDGIQRGKFYSVVGTPQVFISGKPGPEEIGGPRAQAQMTCAMLSAKIEEELEKPAGAQIKLLVERQGDKIDMQAEVSGLKKTGSDVRLRFLLVEDVVRYAGGNRQRLHYRVVRAFPGGLDGVALKEAASKHSATVNVAEVARSLDEYLTEFQKQLPFRSDYQPLGKQLRIVALVQDDASKDILQAAQVEAK